MPIDSKSSISELKQALDFLRSHRTCECCGKEMICLGPDLKAPPAGIWVHTHTQIVICLQDDVETFENGSKWERSQPHE